MSPRFILAFFLAPLATAVAWFLLVLGVGTYTGDENAFGLATFLGGSVAVVAYGHALFLGLPAAAFLSAKHRLTRKAALGSSVLIAVFPYGIWSTGTRLLLRSSEWVNGVETVSGGQLTGAGWVREATLFGVLAASGLIAGAAWLSIARPGAKQSVA